MTLLAVALAFLVIPQVHSFAPTSSLSPTVGPSTRHPCRHEIQFPTAPRRHINVSPTAAISPTVASAIGHVIAGNLATPFVLNAVVTWYGRIPLPSWTPPNGIFGPVWLALYASIGVAVARVARVGGVKSLPVMLWGLHMALNMSWAPLFFGMAKLRAALVVNCLMVASLPVLIALFATVDPTAAVLLVPYTAWVSFATVLNYAICKLNPMDGAGYSKAMLEADIAKLQNEAAKKVGL
jgi:translocator protein